MPESELKFVKRHSAEQGASAGNKQTPGIQRGTLTLLMSVGSLVFVLGGSGGVVAEIFHSKLVLDRAYSFYLRDVEQATREGFRELQASAERGFHGASTAIGMAKSEAAATIASAGLEARVIDAERMAVQPQREAQLRSYWESTEPARRQLFGILRAQLVRAKREIREKVNDPNYEIQLLVTSDGLDGVPRKRLFPIPWTDEDQDSFIVPHCVHFDGLQAGICDEDMPPGVDLPETGSELVDPDEFTFSTEEQVALRLFREAHGALERALFLNGIDLVRYKRSLLNSDMTGSSLERASELERELAETESALANSRLAMDSTYELLELARLGSGAQKTGAFAYLVQDSRANLLGAAGREFRDQLALRRWIRDDVPELTKAALVKAAEERERRQSPEHRSLRPQLLNLYEAIDSGRVSVGGLRLPAWLLGVVCLLVLLATGRWLLGVRSDLRQRILMWGFIPVGVLLLVFPVQNAWSVNSATEAAGEAFAGPIIKDRVSGLYVVRAASLEASLRRFGDVSAKASVANAEASGRAIVAGASTRMAATGAMMQARPAVQIVLSRGFEMMQDWQDDLPGEIQRMPQAMIITHALGGAQSDYKIATGMARPPEPQFPKVPRQ